MMTTQTPLEVACTGVLMNDVGFGLAREDLFHGQIGIRGNERERRIGDGVGAGECGLRRLGSNQPDSRRWMLQLYVDAVKTRSLYFCLDPLALETECLFLR